MTRWPRAATGLFRPKIRNFTPLARSDAEFSPGMAQKWSTAFMLSTADAPTGHSAGSMAWVGLGNTYFWIDPKRWVAGVILMQVLPFVDAELLQAFTDFETATYKSLQAA